VAAHRNLTPGDQLKVGVVYLEKDKRVTRYDIGTLADGSRKHTSVWAVASGQYLRVSEPYEKGAHVLVKCRGRISRRWTITSSNLCLTHQDEKGASRLWWTLFLSEAKECTVCR